jgi:broad specificity phosphatase PhoE
MDELLYKGSKIFIYGKSEPDHWSDREDGESWIDMRRRTEKKRRELEKENDEVRLEIAELIRGLLK